METNQPFRPTGFLFPIVAAPTANPPATLLGSGLAGDVTVRAYNPSGQDVILAFGPTSAAASAGAVFPVLSGASPNPQVFILKNGETRGITQNGSGPQQQLFVAAASLTGSGTVWTQAGFGIV